MPVSPTPQLIADEIARRIIRGELSAGERLRQDYVAAEFGVSHVPVREALLKLAARGLVVSQHNKGVQVAPLDPLAQRELKLMRLALEPLTLLHSVPHLTPAQVREADRLREACDQAPDIYTWEEMNRAFHMQIYEACEMPRLLETVENMQNLAARYILVHYRSRWRPRIDTDHHGIIAAIRRRDAKGAAAILERHLQRLSQVFDPRA
ncbi:GntR family transcriptional regulator [Rhodobacter capsulatus]|jgi:DNA-binding GntR family transcriptional regulator|uniref:Transcriptional regulator, GntR family n=1 Tax=Rhodobacter capsulatus (strain ATCC BAA-309 / NBRC 16581 / SB1003) TaxID=272942 RepID=D5AS71_RHOCB|nr:GntR family transcriptional regulator [Rhodobacter capsulatus]ADE87093.1 transcriptional regulator, GntR family [Rhodobacter capsulatus SB 1003]ETD00214.1 GntR family transcriptional regulator [Rhodobacter capsulatus DE442]ETD74446.1 GntR family transcriptional regulator [Rhodobacter capsulatus R121]ETD80674.1 GntR family transcriptional regulator [Rhodobacter capsulatus B6]ETD80960.1 GntR family transcriptional regulator [Rhodobacter capsulatus YW1]